jgi:hypothetical protein
MQQDVPSPSFLPARPFWICAYKHGTARIPTDRAATLCRKRKVLPPAPELVRLLASIGLESSLQTPHVTDGPYVVGLALAAPARCSLDPAMLSFEERLLQRYHGGESQPIYSVDVVEFWVLPARPHLRHCRAHSDGHAVPWTLRRPVSLPAERFWQHLRLQRAGTSCEATVPSIVGSWGLEVDDDSLGSVPILAVVEPVALLIQTQRWRSVVLLNSGRLPDGALSPAWVGRWPPPALPSKVHDAQANANVPQPKLCPTLNAAADWIAERAPLDLGGQSLAHALRTLAGQLEGWSSDPAPAALEMARGGARWSGSMLFLLAVLTIKFKSESRASVELWIRLTCETFMPPAVVAELMENVRLSRNYLGGALLPQGVHTRRWSQCMLDMGFMLATRAWFASIKGQVFVYGLADSSPQKGYDWLNSSVHVACAPVVCLCVWVGVWGGSLGPADAGGGVCEICSVPMCAPRSFAKKRLIWRWQWIV